MTRYVPRPAKGVNFTIAVLAAVVNTAIRAQVLMLGAGIVHSYYPEVPAIGFVPSAALVWIFSVVVAPPVQAR